MSSLEALSGFKLELDLVQKIIKDYTVLTNAGKKVVLCWIPGHVNIPGNERADTTAKSALSLPATHKKFPACDLIPRVSKFCMAEWQDIWSCCSGNKLYSIYPTVGSVLHNKFLSPHDTVIINRLRIGHTRLTHSYLLSGDDQPTCNTRGLPLTVYHILLECSNLNVTHSGDDKKKKEREEKVQKVTELLYFTYSHRSPLWTCFKQILRIDRYCGPEMDPGQWHWPETRPNATRTQIAGPVTRWAVTRRPDSISVQEFRLLVLWLRCQCPQ